MQGTNYFVEQTITTISKTNSIVKILRRWSRVTVTWICQWMPTRINTQSERCIRMKRIVSKFSKILAEWTYKFLALNILCGNTWYSNQCPNLAE